MSVTIAFYALLERVMEKYFVPTLFGIAISGVVYWLSAGPSREIIAVVAGAATMLMVIGVQGLIHRCRWIRIPSPFADDAKPDTGPIMADDPFQWNVNGDHAKYNSCGYASFAGRISCTTCTSITSHVYERSLCRNRRQKIVEIRCPKCGASHQCKGTWKSVQEEMYARSRAV